MTPYDLVCFLTNMSLLVVCLQVDPNKEILLDIDSTSSDSDTQYLTPLTELRQKELVDKKRQLEQSKPSHKKSKRKKKHEKSKKKKV